MNTFLKHYRGTSIVTGRFMQKRVGPVDQHLRVVENELEKVAD